MAKAPEVEHLQDGIRGGDEASFETLVRLLTEPLYQYAASIVYDPGAAEEIVQNTFIRVFKRRRTLDASLSLRGYCYRITTNLARNHLRDRRLRREREVEALSMREHTAPDPQLTAIAREAWQMVDKLKILNAELSGADVRAAKVEVYDSQGQLASDASSPLDVGSTDAANKLITVVSLRAGAYRVVVKLDGYRDAEVEVQLDQSQASEREITLRK
jgi:RNA polymerase sigma factor (sigma-70 family)